MTREDIVRALNWPGISAWAQSDLLVRIERESCAAICDGYGMPDGTSPTAAALAKAIRGRGQQ